jgi:2-methylaconitate cis-trans-isomerase PrpF
MPQASIPETVACSIPCTLMRGGTSRGPFFLSGDLPTDPAARDAVLLSAMGSGQELQIDGLGGGNPLTSKVAIVSRSMRPGIDVDYLFAQVKVREREVDTSPNCGNMLSGVGPFAIERGLVKASIGSTLVRIFNVNTGKVIEATVQTPMGRVIYEGDCRIDGVPDASAPVELAFLDVAGAKTGKLLPTGRATDVIDGIAVSCVDAATPLVIIRAADLGKTASETPAELDGDPAFMARLDAVRVGAGRLMGLGDVTGLVIPKPVIVGAPQRGGSLAARYFMPHATHKAFAVTGAVGLATAVATPGTLARDLCLGLGAESLISIEHPAGIIQLSLTSQSGNLSPRVSLLRTARKILEGTLHVRVPVTASASEKLRSRQLA